MLVENWEQSVEVTYLGPLAHEYFYHGKFRSPWFENSVGVSYITSYL